MNERVKLVIVDDHALCRRGLADLLTRTAAIDVVATTGNAEDAQRLVQELAPDLVVLDLRMSPTDGLTLLKRLREQGCRTPVVILTMSDARADVAEALRLGVQGYLLKDMEPDAIADAIWRAAQGELVMAPAVAAKLGDILRDRQSANAHENAIRQLTGRERQILAHVAAGRSNKAIARALGISHDTVKLHVRHILAKLSLSSRVEAAVFAVEHRVTLETLNR
ncbi:MAG: response regulator [Sutterellaceae bacterium]|nr:response regulator [Burkholderiaceae bacterium]MCX7902405.1 response regulator [Burkholderiaceae bacterium]MDW8430903.1 response regulator [Sutterellaceae bacterium]